MVHVPTHKYMRMIFCTLQAHMHRRHQSYQLTQFTSPNCVVRTCVRAWKCVHFLHIKIFEAFVSLS